MTRPVCVSCCAEMRCHKNSRAVEVQVKGRGYQVWSGDEYQCPSCLVRVVTGWGRQPMAETFMSSYVVIVSEELEAGNLIVLREDAT